MQKYNTLIAATLIAAMLSGCGAAPVETQPPTTVPPASTAVAFNKAVYKQTASDLRNQIVATTVILGSAVQYQVNLWDASIKVGAIVTADKLTTAAKEQLAKDGQYKWEDIQTGMDHAAELYKRLVSCNPEGIEAEKIFETLDDMYDSLLGIHNLATAPSGDLDDFADDFSDFLDEILNGKDKLDTLLK